MPSLTDSIGRVLGGRYRLVTALGTGASAHVYLADDVSLHRRVAIKLLHPALAGDQAFLRRFRAEARAVAALNHPNVLQCFDWGEEGGEPYLVLEYLSGGSLRGVYDTGALLTPEQAVRVGLQAAAGLDYAHRRGLVHRDVKPANLLFDAEQRLRIADFGLARALAEAAWTEPDGAILGTARYAAPEQVEGWVLDGKADVYALALVLYEGVTGEAAFIGDTTVATLMARVGALLPDHPALGPLGEVLVWAAAPVPAERLDAAGLAHRLRALAETLPDPAPLPIAEAPDPEPGEGGATAAPRRPARLGDPADRTELGIPTFADGTPRVVTTTAAPPAEGEDEAHRAHRRWPWVVAVVVLLAALVGGGVAYAVHERLFTPSHAVPDLVGDTPAAAQARVRSDHFTVRTVSHTSSISVPSGRIVSQRPASGRPGRPVTAKEGTEIAVVVSSGPPSVAVPSVAGFSSCNDAVKALAAVHLVGACPAAAAQYSDTAPAGSVLGTTPTSSAVYGSTVTIVTSKGHAPLPVPAVTGPTSSWAAASATLKAAGFVPVQAQQYSSTVPAGQVIGTSPPAGAGPQPYGSTVTVDVSLGPQPVTVPPLQGDSVARATAALQALGLVVGGPYGPPGSKTVLSTSPAAGASVLPGTTVGLYAR